METIGTTCKYCNEPEHKQHNPGMVCESCICFVHLACLRRPGTPGDFSCDVFFDFTCEDCSPDKKEVFVRNKFPWVNVILLTLHHLTVTSYGISNHGFFHYKTHVCSFIDRNWQLLFGSHSRQKKNWVGTIAGALSVYNHILFRSGFVALGEAGWWRLLHGFSPAVAAQIVQEVARFKVKSRPRHQLASFADKSVFIAKVTEMGYSELINHEPEMPIPGVEPVSKKRRLDSESTALASNSLVDFMESDRSFPTTSQEGETSSEPVEPLVHDSFSDVVVLGTAYTHIRSPEHNLLPSDSSSIYSYQQHYDSDSRSGSPLPPLETETKQLDIKIKKEKEDSVAILKRDSLFSTQLNSVVLPWMENDNFDKSLVEMSHYEEVQMLKKVEGLIPKVRDPNKKAELQRLKAKLALRRLKRHRHLPIFDLDRTARMLGGYLSEETRLPARAQRVLDRFQRSYLQDNLCGTIASTNYGTVVLSRADPIPFRSAYSGTMLKPYIRRDPDADPLWLRLMDELLMKTNKHRPGYRLPARAPLDYWYVRPQHIAAVNALCEQFFWPGIDLSEALEYPEFSCVVTYRRLVVGCAFLVPDARAHEAYVSFIVTRPEWRNAKIGSFMLYHLLQTCTGKDVTLHVSPTNPAVFLYQKFGFKVEEMIQDFYEKYYDIEYKGCRHALFLRLVR